MTKRKGIARRTFLKQVGRGAAWAGASAMAATASSASPKPEDTSMESQGRPWQIHLIPGSHFDYGWAATPGECLSYGAEIIRSAIEDIDGEYPEYAFTVEYALFMKHFLETYPEYLPAVKRLVKKGKLEVCSTMSGMIEQWMDGEQLIHQLVQAKRWIRATLDVDPVTCQHTDLPGHILQIAQFLRGADIQHLAYSRHHPPVPLHRWRSPDGSEITACCHYHEGYEGPCSWEGYGWGWNLFVNNADMNVVYKELPPALQRREALWPAGVNALLMGCESDLQPPEPSTLDRVRQWNETYPQWPVRLSTLSEFFRAVDPEQIPVYQGEAPYSFFSLPSIYIPCAQHMRRGENALSAAEKWSVFAQMTGLGQVQRERLRRARDSFYLPHDHNTAGRRGEVNDAERFKDALSARLEGESVLQEKAMTFTTHIGYQSLRDGVYPITVFNSLSWDRDDVVETYVELPMTGVRSLNMHRADGTPVPSQIVATDERQGWCRVTLVFVAQNVPAHGYDTYYIRPGKEEEPVTARLEITESRLVNRFFQIHLENGQIVRLQWNETDLRGNGPRPFNVLYALEDRQQNIEAGPWDEANNYTGKTWEATIQKTEVVEHGPVRAIWRIYGEILQTRFEQEVIAYDQLERIDFRQILHYTPTMDTMTRVTYPLNVPGGQATYESPYGAVRLEKDEMPGTFRGHGERWVQKWIDISNDAYGVTLATRQVSHVITNEGIEPILARTAIDCGTLFYYFDQDDTYRLEFALYPHKKHWKDAAAHRRGWEFNQPLYSANWTTCFPIQPLRRSKKLPERDSLLRLEGIDAVVTALNVSEEDPESVIVRIVEYAGRTGMARLQFQRPIAKAAEVNFLEECAHPLSLENTVVSLPVKAYGIHTVRVTFRKP